MSNGTPKWDGRHNDHFAVGFPSIVTDLRLLLKQRRQFMTVLADPPWRYENLASRVAAENHFRTMTVEEICSVPVSALVGDRAHLHLWTTNAFLESAFTVMRAWGFEFNSCMIWIKPKMGMATTGACPTSSYVIDHIRVSSLRAAGATRVWT